MTCYMDYCTLHAYFSARQRYEIYRRVVIPGSPSIPRTRRHVHFRFRTTPCRPIVTASGSSSLESWSWSDSTSGVVLTPFFFLGLATLRFAKISFPPLSSAFFCFFSFLRFAVVVPPFAETSSASYRELSEVETCYSMKLPDPFVLPPSRPELRGKPTAQV